MGEGFRVSGPFLTANSMPEPSMVAKAGISWPQPRHFAAAALAWALLVIYGSLTPFAYEPMEWGRAARILQSIIEQPPQPAPRSDWATNFLLLVPLGFAALGALMADRDTTRRRGISVVLVLLGGLALSISVEAAQLWFPPRHPAKADVIAQTLGNVLGMGLWILGGQRLTDWTRRQVRGPGAGRLAWLLAIYAAGLLVYSLLPLDLTIRPGDLWDKYKAGQVNLIPFGSWQWTAASVYRAARDVAIFLPIGALVALWPSRGNAEGRLLLRWLAGVALVGLIELMQLFVRSRHSDVTDVILGAIGVGGGLRLAALWRRGSDGGLSGRYLKVASLAAFALLLMAIYLEPFAFSADHQAAFGRLAAMFRVPLEALRQGELLEMVSNVLRKLLLFGVLGALAGEISAAGRKSTPARVVVAWGIAAGFVVAAIIETAQAWFPPHVPDVTDIAWGAFGGGLGAYLGQLVETTSSVGTE
jgi:VanZ family protein